MFAFAMATQRSARKKRNTPKGQSSVRTEKSTSVKLASGRWLSYDRHATEVRTGPFEKPIRDPGKSNLLKPLKLFVSYAKAVVMGWIGNDPS